MPSDETVEKVARAIYEARGAHEPPRAWRKWEDIGDEAQAVWHRCAQAALAAAEAETQPVGWQFAVGQTVEKYVGEAIWNGIIVARYQTTKGKRRYVVEVQPQGFQMIAVPEQLRASPPTRDEAVKALDLIAKMAGNVVLNGKQSQISHEDHMRAWADIEATAIRARGETAPNAKGPDPA